MRRAANDKWDTIRTSFLAHNTKRYKLQLNGFSLNEFRSSMELIRFDVGVDGSTPRIPNPFGPLMTLNNFGQKRPRQKKIVNFLRSTLALL